MMRCPGPIRRRADDRCDGSASKIANRWLMIDIHTAHKAGARLRLACETAGIDVRTLQRWNAGEGIVSGDGRPPFGTSATGRIC